MKKILSLILGSTSILIGCGGGSSGSTSSIPNGDVNKPSIVEVLKGQCNQNVSVTFEHDIAPLFSKTALTTQYGAPSSVVVSYNCAGCHASATSTNGNKKIVDKNDFVNSIDSIYNTLSINDRFMSKTNPVMPIARGGTRVNLYQNLKDSSGAAIVGADGTTNCKTSSIVNGVATMVDNKDTSGALICEKVKAADGTTNCLVADGSMNKDSTGVEICTETVAPYSFESKVANLFYTDGTSSTSNVLNVVKQWIACGMN